MDTPLSNNHRKFPSYRTHCIVTPPRTEHNHTSFCRTLPQYHGCRTVPKMELNHDLLSTRAHTSAVPQRAPQQVYRVVVQTLEYGPLLHRSSYYFLHKDCYTLHHLFSCSYPSGYHKNNNLAVLSLSTYSLMFCIH